MNINNLNEIIKNLQSNNNSYSRIITEMQMLKVCKETNTERGNMEKI